MAGPPRTLTHNHAILLLQHSEKNNAIITFYLCYDIVLGVVFCAFVVCMMNVTRVMIIDCVSHTARVKYTPRQPHCRHSRATLNLSPATRGFHNNPN